MKPLRQKLLNLMGRSESGQSVILLAMGFVALIAFVGITTDVSLMFVRYSQLSRSVDSAAVAAANQMRQDRSVASVSLAARQFIQLHGLNPVDVLVDTCSTLPVDRQLAGPDQDELCRGDLSKLVRVTAQIESQTIFLRLLGFPSFILQASAVSETATLDVVIVMDVSESMLRYTTYEDWAAIGQGVIYIPPRALNIYNAKYGSAPNPKPSYDEFWLGFGTNAQAQFSLLNTWQVNVNSRLDYGSGALNAGGQSAVPNPAFGNQPDSAYQVTWINNYDFDPTDGLPATIQQHPRRECRVTFYPFSEYTGVWFHQGMYEINPTTGERVYIPLADTAPRDNLYTRLGQPWGAAVWDGFVPNYNFYGCCNDPNGDWDFSDLVCQPFKQARDAAELFLERIDFFRGDRVAFVTFDRTAYLVNPYGYIQGSAECPPGNTKEDCRGGTHMITDPDDATKTLQRLLGVRAEPNFYVYTPGNYSPGVEATTAKWTSYAAGLDASGASLPLDFGRVDSTTNFYADFRNGINTQRNLPVEAYNYPVSGNCPFQNAALRGDRTLFHLGLQNIMRPNTSDAPGWATYQTPGGIRLQPTPANRSTYNLGMSYELWASCRGSNLGAALREGNNALVNPRTIRQSGTIWVIVMLSDGGAGASDPVRRNREKLRAAEPYTWNSATGTFGQQGDYGAFGVCPYGTPTQPGELVLTDGETQPASFPYCSDEIPYTRNRCNFRPTYTLTDAPEDPLPALVKVVGGANRAVPPLGDKDYLFFGQTGGPSSIEEEPEFNRVNNNIYDIDLQGCDLLYDVDDYARDWADYIALRRDNPSDANALLPSIFTIGFGLEFPRRTQGTVTYDIRRQEDALAICRLNIPDCLGEEILRYIADVGDNNQVDNDYFQAWLKPGTTAGTSSEPFGPRDPCQTQDQGHVNGTYDLDGNNFLSQEETERMYGHLRLQTSCGNYYFAPDFNELQFVFNDIASRMFTRLAR
jgi:hypothetical protein